MVTQDTSLLHRSVRDNILYGRPDASEEMMVEAARRAEALDFIDGLTDPKGRKGFDAHVGERGVKLSGGQRQRVAIARVMLKDAPILILDEATSALDSEVEAAIQENLYRLMEGKTVIAIAHRLSTIAAMDRLVVMDGGRIIEEGPHDVLVANGGLYAQLWGRQSGGFLLDEELRRNRPAPRTLQRNDERGKRLPRKPLAALRRRDRRVSRHRPRGAAGHRLAVHPLFREPGERPVSCCCSSSAASPARWMPHSTGRSAG